MDGAPVVVGGVLTSTRDYTLIELCCGGAALTLHVCGARRSLVPYQGGKWRFRGTLASLMRDAGCDGAPLRVQLYDPGPWGIAAGAVLRASTRAGLIDHLDQMSRADARAVFDTLQGHRVPDDPVEFAAQFLFLQRLSYSGKAVGVRDHIWRSPGFNSSSAYGVVGTDRFGNVNPMIPSLVKTLRSYASLVEPEALECSQSGAQPPPGPCAEKTIVFLDPPYAGSTAYPDAALDRAGVVALARAWHEAGASVMISEGEPIEALVEEGWRKQNIYAGRQDTSPFRGKQEEWVTLSPGWGGSPLTPPTPARRPTPAAQSSTSLRPPPARSPLRRASAGPRAVASRRARPGR